jgi:very-short-patch-repair endonuclease
LVIELDDKSHDDEERQTRDAFVDRALGAAGLPILHLSARRTYSTRDLAEQVRCAIG